MAEVQGRLRVAPRVVERIAVVAARGITDVPRVANRFPRARADVVGDHARVSIDIAVTWPALVADTAAEVRAAVARDVAAFTPLVTDHVDVRVREIVGPVALERVQ